MVPRKNRCLFVDVFHPRTPPNSSKQYTVACVAACMRGDRENAGAKL